MKPPKGEQRETTLVVPCYNEAARLDADRFLEALDTIEALRFLFVDDGSEDDTLALLEALREECSERIEVMALARNRGKAEAVRRGMLWAMGADATVVGYWDADLSTPLSELFPLRAVLERRPRVDIVLGSRVQLAGRSIERSHFRHYAGRVFATVAAAALKLAIYDTQCGAKLFRTGEVTREIFEEPFVSRWIFDVEVLVRYRQRFPGRFEMGLDSPIQEVPLREWRDVGASRIRTSDWLAAPLELARIARRYRSG